METCVPKVGKVLNFSQDNKRENCKKTTEKEKDYACKKCRKLNCNCNLTGTTTTCIFEKKTVISSKLRNLAMSGNEDGEDDYDILNNGGCYTTGGP